MADAAGDGGLLGRVVVRATTLLLSPPLLTIFAALQAVMLAVMAAAYLASRVDPASNEGEAGTGDFLAFFTGARILREGMGAELYDFAIQQDVQSDIVGTQLPYFQPYLNPPGLAWLLSFTVDFGYVRSFLIFDLVMATACIGGLALAVREMPGLGGTVQRWTAVLLSIGFQPIARMMVGGQNTPLTLGLLCALFVALKRERTLLAGLLLGLLTYKPQYVALLALVLLVRGRWREVALGAAVGLGHYGIGALACGPDWPLDMLSAMRVHEPRERAENGADHFAILPVAKHSLPEPFGAVVGGAVVLAIAALVLWVAWRETRPDRFGLVWGLAVTGALAVSPHLQYYEAGLLVLPVLLALDAMHRVGLGARVALALAYAAYPAYEWGERLGVQPLVFGLVGVLAWLVYRALSPPGAEPRLVGG